MSFVQGDGVSSSRPGLSGAAPPNGGSRVYRILELIERQIILRAHQRFRRRYELGVADGCVLVEELRERSKNASAPRGAAKGFPGQWLRKAPSIVERRRRAGRPRSSARKDPGRGQIEKAPEQALGRTSRGTRSDEPVRRERGS